MAQLYSYATRIDHHRAAFHNDAVVKPEDKELIEAFLNEYGTARNYSPATSYRYYAYMKTVLKFLREPLTGLSLKEYLRFRRALQRDEIVKHGHADSVTYAGEQYSEASKEDLDQLLRRVLRWYKRKATGRVKEDLALILEERPHKPDRNKMGEPDVLSEDEVTNALKHALTERDRALIAVLWETGARTGEILTLRTGDLKPLFYSDAETGLLLTMRQSKTTKRTLPLIESAPYLRGYLNDHPRNDDPEAPLWLMTGGKPLTYPAMRKAAGAACQRAGIRKRIYNHLWRHSRATYLANKGWSEAQLCAWFGWRIGSEMPATYIRRSGINLTAAALAMHGIKIPNGDEAKAKLLPRPCYFCRHPNPRTHEYCERCGKPLDATRIAEQEQRASAAIDSLVEKKIAQILAKHGLVPAPQ